MMDLDGTGINELNSRAQQGKHQGAREISMKVPPFS